MNGLVNSTRIDAQEIKYVEDKPLDMVTISSLLAESQQKNHWTNFGPVSVQIEEEIAQMLELRDDLCVVMCSSGTAALHGIIALQETLADKDMRWLTSSFGYYSSMQGPLKNAEIVDCDENAMLDLSLVDPNSFDGFVVTNTFGQASNLDDYYAYAKEHNKVMCVDSALAFGSTQHGPNECISFHHTKPWGFGEGGCAIIEKKHEKLFRSLICFGHMPGTQINRRASNGKISEIAAAYCLARVRHMASLSKIYKAQYLRIGSIGRSLGLKILGDVSIHPGTPASVPFLAPEAFSLIGNDTIPTGRYYHPLKDTKVANSIYGRIVNVPCHPALADLSKDVIKQALIEITAQSTVKSRPSFSQPLVLTEKVSEWNLAASQHV